MRYDPHKQLFTIGEIKAMAVQRGKPTEMHKAVCADWAREYAAKVGRADLVRVNTKFFAEHYLGAREEIRALAASCTVKRVQSEEKREAPSTIQSNGCVIEDTICARKRARPGARRNGCDSDSGHSRNGGEKAGRGAHWEQQEKDMFFKWFNVLGKDWKGLRAKFPNKTDKQLRNFYQNNRTKLGGEGSPFGTSRPANNSFIHS